MASTVKGSIRTRENAADPILVWKLWDCFIMWMGGIETLKMMTLTPTFSSWLGLMCLKNQSKVIARPILFVIPSSLFLPLLQVTIFALQQFPICVFLPPWPPFILTLTLTQFHLVVDPSKEISGLNFHYSSSEVFSTTKQPTQSRQSASCLH